ncbi:hypothetical protein F1649_11890 [Arcticibacter tournemirensis]|uniref:Uncharacterized protein n=1 Tax=Arcticibacter tournemirensis TaxID=699437 RepID=A0A5M9H646_9SPHI|nr:hypothetical protein [Arcticibacter tournemirensis]KAA8482406.1 hypothetical protein F1649_11890 [Arcticibacter tournemirensis]
MESEKGLDGISRFADKENVELGTGIVIVMPRAFPSHTWPDYIPKEIFMRFNDDGWRSKDSAL